MGNFVAILILVACPSGSTACMKDPVRVVSYDSSVACQAAREMEVRKASRPGFEILGECNSFHRSFLAGKAHLNITRTISTVAAGAIKNDQTEALAGFTR
jgi:hypothetical protein